MQLDLFDIINFKTSPLLTKAELDYILEASDWKTLPGQAEGTLNSFRKYLAAAHAFTIHAFSGAGKYRMPEAAEMYSKLKEQMDHHAQVLDRFGAKFGQLAQINLEAFNSAVEQQKLFVPVYDLDPRLNIKYDVAYNQNADKIYTEVLNSLMPKQVKQGIPQPKVDSWISPQGIALQDKIGLGEETTSGAVAGYNKPVHGGPIKRTPSFHRYLDKKPSCPGCSFISKGWVAPHMSSPKSVTCRYCGTEHSASANKE